MCDLINSTVCTPPSVCTSFQLLWTSIQLLYLRNALRECLQIWNKCPLWLNWLEFGGQRTEVRSLWPYKTHFHTKYTVKCVKRQRGLSKRSEVKCAMIPLYSANSALAIIQLPGSLSWWVCRGMQPRFSNSSLIKEMCSACSFIRWSFNI